MGRTEALHPHRAAAEIDRSAQGETRGEILRLAQGGIAEVHVLGVVTAAGKRDLSGVAAHLGAAPGEDHVRRLRLAIDEQRHEDRCTDLLCRGAGEADQVAMCTRWMLSKNITSPSSARWTGHLAAIVRSRSTCSSGTSSGRRMTSWNLVGQPRSAGLYSTSTSTGPMSQPLRTAYISIVIAVHEARLTASSS